jgi:ACS family glucarate transporter-like MFS transporter
MKATEPVEQPTGVRWIILALSCGASFLLYLHRYTWNIIDAKLKDDPYKLTHSQTGLLFSLFYYTYAFLQIPSGVVIDRFGPRRFLTASILLWSLALALLGVIFLAPPGASGTRLVWVMVLAGIARFLFGAAQAGCYPALTRASRVWFAPQGRTALQGLIASTAGRTGGAASSVILATVLMAWLGLSWQVSLLWLGLIGMVFGLLFWWGYGDSPAVDPRVNDAERHLIQGGQAADPNKLTPAAADTGTAPGMLPWGSALRSRTMRWFVCQQFMDAGSDVAFLSLIGTYFLQARGVDLQNTGWLASLPLIGGALGGYVGGWLNEWLIALTGNRRWSRSGVGFTGKVIGCAMLLLVSRQETATAAAVMLMLAKFFGDWSQPTVWGTCTDIGGRFSATVFSIINTAGTIGGMVMPLVFGKLLDGFTRVVTEGDVTTKITDWDPLFYLLAGMYVSSGLFWLLVDCTKPLERKPDA